MIRMNEIKKTYHMGSVQQVVLDGVDVTIREGEMTALMGASGSGKTTLLNIIGLLDEADEGEYVLNGRDVVKSSGKEKAQIRSHEIGFVFQSYNLVQDLNVYENIILPIELDGKRVDKKFVKEIMEVLQLEEKREALPRTLSGGQQQRAAIARAIAATPSLLLCDVN